MVVAQLVKFKQVLPVLVSPHHVMLAVGMALWRLVSNVMMLIIFQMMVVMIIVDWRMVGFVWGLLLNVPKPVEMDLEP